MQQSIHIFDRKQAAYEAARKLRREQWAISDAEDFCVRKEVEPGTYKVICPSNG